MKIGLFDSGLGGLTVVIKILEKYKNSGSDILELVYLADTINAPYGAKTQLELRDIIHKNIDFLYNQNCDFIVVACNSASILKKSEHYNMNNAISNNTYHYNHSYIDMITPTLDFCKKNLYKNNLIFATTATIESGLYKNSFENNDLKLDQYALPELATLIDSNASTRIVDKYIKTEVNKCFRELNIFKNNTLENRDAIEVRDTTFNTKYDAIILGCTHYPLFTDIFEKYCKGIKIINPADPVSDFVISKIKEVKSKQEKEIDNKNKNRNNISLQAFLTKKNDYIEKYILENIKVKSLEIKVI